jgi:hypothetical protein
MQSGAQSVDPRVLAGVSAGGYGHSGGGGAPVAVNYITNLNIAGDVTSEDRLLRKLRSTQQQWSRRNGGASGWSATR